MGAWHAKGFKQGCTQKKNKDKPWASLSFASEEKGSNTRRAEQGSSHQFRHQNNQTL